MTTHILPKNVKEKILSVTPVPSNIKNSQILDEYIKESLIGNKKNTLNQEKFYPRPSSYHIETVI